MPRLRTPMKDVASCDKFRRVAKQTLTRKFPNGGTQLRLCGVIHLFERIHRELKHLSTCGKEINLEIPLVVASEQGIAQTVLA
jgi:hypothetical protein